MSLTTHVLDIVKGGGAAGMRVEARRIGAEGVVSVTLDEGGRANLLDTLRPGLHEVLFYAGEYLGSDAFYDVIPVRFMVRDPAQHYHIPLILSPFGYSTYRGG
jgi:5-hydroxyisourate hydrolase